MQLNRICTLEGTLELLTGLHIGAGGQEMHIGGIDNTVIKHPYTLEPYIPGSSLKGRMRSLLEWRAGVVAECNGKPVSAQTLDKLSGAKRIAAEDIARLFGLSGDAQAEIIEQLGPTRLAFWDCALEPDWVAERNRRNELFTEAKNENIIDRIRGVAEHPRQTERVPAGARFKFRLSLKQLEGDIDLLNLVLAGLKLLELDSIGGSGSRGYGKICFIDLKLDGEDLQARFDTIQPFAA